MGYVRLQPSYLRPDVDHLIDEVDSSCVLYLPFYKLPGETFYLRDSKWRQCTSFGSIWTPQGRSFDGVDDYLDIPDSEVFSFTAGNPCSILGWVNIPSLPDDYDTLIGKWDNQGPSTREWLFRFGTGSTWEFRLFDSITAESRGRSTTAIIPTNIWTHVAGIYNGGTGNNTNSGTSIYINGERKDTTDLSTVGTFNGMNNTVSKLYLGAVVNTISINTNHLKGRVGEIRMYNRVLNLFEVQRNYELTKWRYR